MFRVEGRTSQSMKTMQNNMSQLCASPTEHSRPYWNVLSDMSLNRKRETISACCVSKGFPPPILLSTSGKSTNGAAHFKGSKNISWSWVRKGLLNACQWLPRPFLELEFSFGDRVFLSWTPKWKENMSEGRHLWMRGGAVCRKKSVAEEPLPPAYSPLPKPLPPYFSISSKIIEKHLLFPKAAGCFVLSHTESVSLRPN